MNKRNVSRFHWQLPENTSAGVPVKNLPGKNYRLEWFQIQQSVEPSRGIDVYCHFKRPDEECLSPEEKDYLTERIQVCVGDRREGGRPHPLFGDGILKPGEGFCDVAIMIARTILIEFRIPDPEEKLLASFTLEQWTAVKSGGNWISFEEVLREKHGLPKKAA